MDAIMAVHREWMACAVAKSQFQMWALTSRFTIATEVINRIYPVYRTREDGRALLEELRDHGTINSKPYLNREYPVDIDPDPKNSVQLDAGLVQLGWVRYDHAGNIVSSKSSSHVEIMRQTPLSLQNYYMYSWDHVEGGWKIYDNDAASLG
jgi:hypothetical protein